MNTEENNTQLPQSSVIVSAFLTGKAKQDFEPFCVKTIRQMEGIGDRYFDHTIMAEFEKFPETFKTSLMVDFFDSIGFYIKIYPHLGGGQIVFYPSFIYRDEKHIDNERNVLFDNGELYYSLTRQEAVFEVIKKANIIYNENVVEAEH